MRSALLPCFAFLVLTYTAGLPVEAARTMADVKMVSPICISENTCKLDQVCSTQMDGGSGIVRTCPIYFKAGKGSRIVLDADASGGEIRVQVLDNRGVVVPGFAFDDCVPVTGKGDRLRVDWMLASGKEDLATGLLDLQRLDRETVFLEFQLKDAKLNGFAVEPGQELPIRLGDGPHLFIDDYLIDKTNNIEKITEQPKKLDKPLISKDQMPQGKAGAPTITYDAQRKVFRMWHWTPPGNEIRSAIVYRESKDGLNWPGEGKVVYAFNGYGTKLLDEGPNCPDPERRYKLSYFAFAKPPKDIMGMYVAFSADGINLTNYEANPVLPYYPLGDPRWTIGVGDIIDPYWDPIRHRYGAFVKMMTGSDKEFGTNSRTTRPNLGTRLTGMTQSLDFIHWEQPWRTFVPDKDDEGVIEFYGADVIVRGDLLIAFVKILRDDLPAEPGGNIEGLGYTVIATSRDGRYWQRSREPFLDRNPKPGTYDRAFAWESSTVTVNDIVYIAYTAYNQGHKTGDRQIGMATIARDRFVARKAAGDASATLKTQLLQYKGRGPMELWLNADAKSGEIRVQVIDEAGKTIPGYSFADCEPVKSDKLDQQVKWIKPLSELKGRPFRLEFSLKNAKVYGFSFAKE